MPVNLAGLGENRQRYGFFTNDAGGILDDLMLANRGDHMFVVVNAACKGADIAHMREKLADCSVDEIDDRALLALQGPAAESVLAGIVPAVADMKFMDVGMFGSDYDELWISRSGYTGEDGYEISVSRAGGGAGAGAAGACGGGTHRPWRARQSAAGGRAVPLWQ